ncbi:hypothetical protein B7494_g544 [Chlorociboria aeruginascens]|nr:hypothetical protein B7494_g544 [Chlorociboria aeruginascens]
MESNTSQGHAALMNGSDAVNSSATALWVNDEQLRDVDIERRVEPTSEKLSSETPQNEPKPPAPDPNIVTWDGPDDPENPMNFSAARKGLITMTMASLTFVITLASSIQSPGTPQVAKKFGVSLEGFAFGPLIWGPASEYYGRRIPLLTGFFIFTLFQIPTAVAQNLYTIFICRFFAGTAGGAPLAVVGGALADMYSPVSRGIAICFFASATKRKFETKNWALRGAIDEHPTETRDLIRRYLFKPYIMLATEPILLLLTIYMGFVYSLLYLFFEAYPISFEEQRGWNAGVGALPFLGILVGVLVGATLIILETKYVFAPSFIKTGRVTPEDRLPSMILGAFLLPIGLFMFAWTSNPHIPWPPQVIGGGFIGAGILMIFLQSMNYIIDVYMMNANSGIAANTLVRSFMGAGFIMFASAMFHNLGVPWATSLLGFLSILLIPVPIAFYRYGKTIRSWSKFSPKL